jgi:hypothetical protein
VHVETNISHQVRLVRFHDQGVTAEHESVLAAPAAYRRPMTRGSSNSSFSEAFGERAPLNADSADGIPITGRIPLPRKRPIPRR